MANPPPVFNQLTWGAHLNFERFLASLPTSLDWLAPLQKQDWQRQGLVVWGCRASPCCHLYAGYALEIHEHMRATEEWKLGGFLIGSPTYPPLTEQQNSFPKQLMEFGLCKTK